MKKFTYGFIALLMAVLFIAGCQKTKLATPGELIASKTTVKLNEPDTLVLVGAENDSVKFSITPSGSNGLFKVGNKARVVFYKAGTYTISATSNGGTPVTKVITVLDADFNPPATVTPTNPTAIYVDFTDENIVITPRYYKMPNSDSTYFTLSAQTSKIYPCGNSSINVTQSQTNNNYILNFANIIQPASTSCILPNTQLKPRLISFYPITAAPITLGTTYPLTINVGSTIYSGVITFNKTYMDIVWNYTSGVTLTTKHVTL